MAKMLRKKKVMMAITQSVLGGAQRYVYDLATSLPKESYEVVVAAGGRGILLDKLKKEGVRTIPLDSLVRNVSIIGDARACIDLYFILRKERPDILQTNSSKMGAIGAVAGRLAGVPLVIFTAHAWEFNAPRPYIQRFIIRTLSQCIVLLSHKTIAVSQSVKQGIGPYLQRKITVVHNGIPEITFKSREDARNTFSKNHGRDGFWIGTIAELHPVKGLSVGIRAFEKFVKSHPGAQYFIIGEGGERERLQKLIRELSLSSSVHLTGFIPDAALFLKAFDVFLLPSLSEGLNYAILEAGAAKLPVVASSTGGITEVISPTCGILTPVSDTRSLSDALESLYVNPQARERLGAALKSRIEEKFSLRGMIRDTAALFSARSRP